MAQERLALEGQLAWALKTMAEPDDTDESSTILLKYGSTNTDTKDCQSLWAPRQRTEAGRW